jgi:hypothetical protein
METWTVAKNFDENQAMEFFIILGFDKLTKELKHTYGPFYAWHEINEFCNIHNIKL